MSTCETDSFVSTPINESDCLKGQNMPDLVPHQHYYYPAGNYENVEKKEEKPPPSYLRDALVKEEDENSSDNVEKAPKRRKTKREIIKPDPKYKGKNFSLKFFRVVLH